MQPKSVAGLAYLLPRNRDPGIQETGCETRSVSILMADG